MASSVLVAQQRRFRVVSVAAALVVGIVAMLLLCPAENTWRVAVLGMFGLGIFLLAVRHTARHPTWLVCEFILEETLPYVSVAAGGIAKRLPHVHHRKPDAFGLRSSEPLIEEIEAGFGTVLAAEPDRAVPLQSLTTMR
jgi:hypothetical protein